MIGLHIANEPAGPESDNTANVPSVSASDNNTHRTHCAGGARANFEHR